MDKSVSKELLRIFKKQKINFNLSHKVNNIISKDNIVTVTTEDLKGNTVTFDGDYCLVSVGRKPYTEGLDLEKVGIIVNERGQISVNITELQTNVENIFAIGDVIKGPMLAHKAERRAFIAGIIKNQKPHINYNLIPNVIYTWPEVASVGKTEQELSENGIEFKSGQFPMRALWKIQSQMDVDGFVTNWT